MTKLFNRDNTDELTGYASLICLAKSAIDNLEQTYPRYTFEINDLGIRFLNVMLECIENKPKNPSRFIRETIAGGIYLINKEKRLDYTVKELLTKKLGITWSDNWIEFDKVTYDNPYYLLTRLFEAEREFKKGEEIFAKE